MMEKIYWKKNVSNFKSLSSSCTSNVDCVNTKSIHFLGFLDSDSLGN